VFAVSCAFTRFVYWKPCPHFPLAALWLLAAPPRDAAINGRSGMQPPPRVVAITRRSDRRPPLHDCEVWDRNDAAMVHTFSTPLVVFSSTLLTDFSSTVLLLHQCNSSIDLIMALGCYFRFSLCCLWHWSFMVCFVFIWSANLYFYSFACICDI
jgi:hypothetical protein